MTDRAVGSWRSLYFIQTVQGALEREQDGDERAVAKQEGETATGLSFLIWKDKFNSQNMLQNCPAPW